MQGRLRSSLASAWLRQAKLEERSLERAEGIEPSSSAWKAVALPLSYARNFDQPLATLTKPVAPILVEGVGFEPT